jgi:UDP-N-acetylglucosamine acyltransferase
MNAKLNSNPADVAPAVHVTAAVAPGAVVDPSARIGPYAVIGPAVTIGPGCSVGPHAVLDGHTRIGPGTWIGPHAVIGAPAQVRGAPAEAGSVTIGARNWIREMVTIHAGSAGGATRVGDGNLLMAYCHVAHDCVIGSGVEVANGVQLAGHVRVEDDAGLGGLAAVHQFVRVGRLAFVGAGAMVSQDVPPFTLASGDRARIHGLNTVGLRRFGFSSNARRSLSRALSILMRSPTIAEALERIRRDVGVGDDLEQLCAFVRTSPRGICGPSRRRASGRTE